MRGAERQNHQHNDVGHLMEEEDNIINVPLIKTITYTKLTHI